MKTNILACLALSLLIMLAACVVSNATTASTATVTNHGGDTGAVTADPSPLVVETQQRTVTPPSEKIPVTDTVNIPECSGKGIPGEVDDNFSLPGTIIYQVRGNKGIFSISGTPLKSIQSSFPDSRQYYVFGFSPDNRWLAFSPVLYSSTGETEFTESSIVLVSSEGKVTKATINTSPFLAQLPNGYRPDSFGNPGYWINNHLLYTTIIYFNPQDPPTSFFVPFFDEVLDPFTGQWKKEIMQGSTGLTASKTVGFSGDLTRAFYNIDPGVELRSLPDQGIKWSDPQRSADHGFDIRWSPDSSHVAFFDPYSALGNPAIFLLDREGKKERTVFNYSEFGETINNLYWSADSRYIAIIGESDLFHELFVYDTLHEKYALRCAIDEEDNLGISGLFWSPDNAYIAYSSVRGSLLVLSLKTGQVTKLIDNAAIAGWSKFSPFKIP